ncbi:MAG: sulfur transferase domain-containing protein [Salinisphaera sp.]|nr:sulfur transferase domain-containing protein [Salinisphaera sp.]
MNLDDYIPFLMQPAPNRYTGGEVNQRALEQARAAGIQHIVNLRPVAETEGFDEAAVAEQLGLAYHHLPIAGPQELTRDNVARFHGILETIGDAPALIHCASSNRVGALFALDAAWEQGQDAESALARGREHGLTKMEPAVRSVLEAG